MTEIINSNFLKSPCYVYTEIVERFSIEWLSRSYFKSLENNKFIFETYQNKNEQSIDKAYWIKIRDDKNHLIVPIEDGIWKKESLLYLCVRSNAPKHFVEKLVIAQFCKG